MAVARRPESCTSRCRQLQSCAHLVQTDCGMISPKNRTAVTETRMAVTGLASRSRKSGSASIDTVHETDARVKRRVLGVGVQHGHARRLSGPAWKPSMEQFLTKPGGHSSSCIACHTLSCLTHIMSSPTEFHLHCTAATSPAGDGSSAGLA